MIHAKRSRSSRKYFRSLETSDHREKDRDRWLIVLLAGPVRRVRAETHRLQSELLSVCFFSVSLYRNNKNWKNFKSRTRLPVLRFFFWQTSVSWTNIQYSSRCENLQFLSSAGVLNISPSNRSLAKKKRRAGNRVCELKFFHFLFIKLY